MSEAGGDLFAGLSVGGSSGGTRTSSTNTNGSLAKAALAEAPRTPASPAFKAKPLTEPDNAVKRSSTSSASSRGYMPPASPGGVPPVPSMSMSAAPTGNGTSNDLVRANGHGPSEAPSTPVVPDADSLTAQSRRMSSGSVVDASPVTDKLLGMLGGAQSTQAAQDKAKVTTPTPMPTQRNSNIIPSSKTKFGSALTDLKSIQLPTTEDMNMAGAKAAKELASAQKPAPAPSSVAAVSSAQTKKKKPKRSPLAPAPTVDQQDSVVTTSVTATRNAAVIGSVHPDTPIPNSDVALRLFRAFVKKTQPLIPKTHGGTQPQSLMRFLFSSPTSDLDRRFQPYMTLIDITAITNGSEHDESLASEHGSVSSDADRIVDSVLGKSSNDTMAKARKAVATFCHMLSVWSHASARLAETDSGSRDHTAFGSILALALDAATALVTHGCLDNVLIRVGNSSFTNEEGDAENDADSSSTIEYQKAVNGLAQSVVCSDLSLEANELAAMKFLLSTGCRVMSSNGEAMLRGTHLLQAIRVLYHIFLTTEVEANKTTARASLQQLVTSVFVRMIERGNATMNSDPHVHDHSHGTIESDHDEHEFHNSESFGSPASRTPHRGPNNENNYSFPSESHRDAFLVLRSLCKLSMRNPPQDPAMHSHIGLQSSGSNTVWDAANGGSKHENGAGANSDSMHGLVTSGKEHLHLVYTHAVHPALESKILALDLLSYILQNTNMKGSFLRHCGSQFHYAIRNYLCVSLLKNCTSDNTQVVNLSLRVFVPIFRNFRSILKTEIEAFVTNVFFVILDSKNSPIEHKCLVVTLFQEICSDPATLAEIFLNYDCDLSAVDLFHRIVNTLSKMSRATEIESSSSSTIGYVAGAGAARMEKIRNDHRQLRLDAMRALRQVLASLHASIVEPMQQQTNNAVAVTLEAAAATSNKDDTHDESNPQVPTSPPSSGNDEKKSLVQIYDSKRKRRTEEAEVVLRFNQKPSAGIAYAVKCGHIDGEDPADVARYLLTNKDTFEKTQIGEYLGREPEYQGGFSLKVLHAYVNMMDFDGLSFDDAIRFYLSGFRLPGEAQKIDRIMEKFAERYTAQNPDVFPTADVAFILAFSIIMLNTDLHNPAIKDERRMTKQGFIRNNRGICDGQDLPEELLISIFDRIKQNPISLKEDDEARERAGESAGAKGLSTTLPTALSPAVFFSSHYDEMDRTKETNFHKERDQIVRTTESLLKRRRHAPIPDKQLRNKTRATGTLKSAVRYVRTEDSGLRDEYVTPMFEVTWGPALAAFSTAMESANGTVGALLAIATDEELELAAENAAETIEVCLTGFRFAVCTAGLCGNNTARDAYVLALARFSQLGTGILLEPRHVRCIQTMLELARHDGELLGSSWEHVFKALSEINRFHQLFQLMARNDRVIAAAAQRRKSRIEVRDRKLQERRERKAAREASDALDEASTGSIGGLSEDDDYDLLFSDDDRDYLPDDETDKKATDEANARTVYEAVSESLIEAIYERSSSLSTTAVTEFVLQLCRVSRMEISNYGGHVGSDANTVDLTQVHYRQHHTLLGNSTVSGKDVDGFHRHQPNIYSLQKLVEVTHYNMDSRPRLVFQDIWTTVAGHLTSTALHSNPAVAMYAVDSFRQLSIQYLQRDELGVFEFQRRFLKPLETVMARSELSTTKELLLKCIERIILMFGSDHGHKGGMLRSGWRPVLGVLGIAGFDKDGEIAAFGFSLLTGQLEQCLNTNKDNDDKNSTGPGVLLAERFIDLVEAILQYIGGPHEKMSLESIDRLLALADYLADESSDTPIVKRRSSTITSISDQDNGEIGEDESPKQELELWWPLLLGISRAIGDPRKKVQQKSLETLFKIINCNFLLTADRATSEDFQTLQLIFRGILTPVLEFAESDSGEGKAPSLPDDFARILTSAKQPLDSSESTFWLDRMFDQFMDGCVSICLRCIETYSDDTLIEEVLAMLNACLLSDSGALAVRGIRRLEQFVTSDLKTGIVSDDLWATVSHMLRRSLAVRNLPRLPSSNSSNSSKNSKDGNAFDASPYPADETEAIREFVIEDNILADRRFIGGNVTMVISSFLSSERFSKTLGLRWRLFLVQGLGRAIRDWEQAASILASHGGKSKPQGHNPPHYVETALYGRTWMNRFLLQLASMKAVVQPDDGNRQVSAQALIKEQTQSLVSAYLAKESLSSKGGTDAQVANKLTSLVKDLMAGFGGIPEDHLQTMSWLNPVLSSCIHTDNEAIRIAIQKLVQRLH